MKTEIQLPKQHGLNRVARLLRFEVDEEQRKIVVQYREHLLADDGTTISSSQIKAYLVEDKERISRMISTKVEKENPKDPEGPKITVQEDIDTVIQEENLAFTAWEKQMGEPIRAAITNKLKTIYNL